MPEIDPATQYIQGSLNVDEQTAQSLSSVEVVCPYKDGEQGTIGELITSEDPKLAKIGEMIVANAQKELEASQATAAKLTPEQALDKVLTFAMADVRDENGQLARRPNARQLNEPEDSKKKWGFLGLSRSPATS